MRMTLIFAIAIWCLAVPQVLLAGGESTSFDYDDNIGFMKDVSTELRQELPMCDVFLDVKWIREMPGGYWVGRVIVDVKIGDKTEQREFVVLEDKRRQGRLQLIDITATDYRGRQFDELIISADAVSGIYTTSNSDIIEKGLSVWKGQVRVMAIMGICGSQSYLERGVSSRFIPHSNKKICIAHPDKKKWLFKKK